MEDNEREKFYLRYWDALGQILKSSRSNLQPRLPSNDYGLSFPIGRKGFRLVALAGRRDEYLGAELQINDPNAQKLFEQLKDHKPQIEEAFGEPLDWPSLENQRRQRVGVYKRGVAVGDEEDWSEQHNWLMILIERLNDVFRDRIKLLPTAPVDSIIDDREDSMT